MQIGHFYSKSPINQALYVDHPPGDIINAGLNILLRPTGNIGTVSLFFAERDNGRF